MRQKFERSRYLMQASQTVSPRMKKDRQRLQPLPADGIDQFFGFFHAINRKLQNPLYYNYLRLLLRSDDKI